MCKIKDMSIIVSGMVIVLLFSNCIMSCKKCTGRYYDSAGNFSLIIPDGWEIKDCEGTVFCAAEKNSSHVSGFRGNMNVVVETTLTGSEREAYIRGSLNQLKQYVKRIRIKDHGSRMINGLKVPWYELSYDPGAGTVWIVIYYYFKGSQVFIVTLSSGEDLLEQDPWRIAAESFRFE